MSDIDIVERLRAGVTRTNDGRPVFPIGELADEAIIEIETLRAKVTTLEEKIEMLHEDVRHADNRYYELRDND